jgi:hypothetical protein
MGEGKQMSSLWTETVHLNSFHIFPKKTVLAPEGYRAVSLTQGHQDALGLQHHLPIQCPLSIIQILPFLPEKVHCHILK